MRFPLLPRLAAALAVTLLVGACGNTNKTPQQIVGGARIERIDKAFDIDRDITRIAIDNAWGEINVRNNDEREVGIHAVVQRMPPRFAEVAFTSRRDGDTLRIEVTVDGATAADAATAAARADLAVYIPNDLALALTTRDSRISATRRGGAIEASTRAGEIQASSLARLDLSSESGQVRAIAIGKRWSGTSRITTDSGRIVLLVPTFGDVALDAHTGGKLGTNFGLSVHAEPGGSEAHAKYGAGSSPLHVQSKTGEIALEQLVLLGDDSNLPEDDD